RTEFVCRFQPVIARVVTKSVFRRIGPNAQLVDDLTQETFVKLWDNNLKALRKFVFQHEHENGFYGFLKVVASNAVEDHFRREENKKRGGGHKKEEDPEKILVVPSKPGSRPAAEAEAQISEVKRCLAERTADTNFARDDEIFWLYYREGRTA